MTMLTTKTAVPLQIDDAAEDALRTLLCGGKTMCDFPSEVEIRDDYRKRIYLVSDAACASTASSEREYTWPDADFVVKEQWSSDGEALVRCFSITLKPGAPARSFSLMELLPYPENVYGWTVWTAFEHFPSEVQWNGGHRMYYGDSCYGTLMPCMSFYHVGQDRGILFGVPHGQMPGGRLSFTCRDYHSEGIEIEFSNLLLKEQSTVRCPLLMAGQRGDFRCTLAFWKERFPAYFARVVSRPQEEAGPFLMSHPELSDATLDRMAEVFSPAWAEVHNHFSKYGEYAPGEDSWESIVKNDYPEDWCGQPMTREKINRHVRELQKRKILAMLYIQCSGDCNIAFAEKNFKDDFALDAAGHRMYSWKDCCFVSALPGTAFHDHMIRQIDAFLERYDGIDGVFLDQLCYQALDFAHADGRSACRNREVALYGDSYDDTLAYLSRKVHAKGMTIWANGPFNMDVAREVDGIMSEGSSSLARTAQYLTIGEKSLLVASYATSAEDVEQMFRHCLVCGGNYSVSGSFSATTVKEYSERIMFLLERCGALVRLLAGCQWVLTAHPFTLPEEMEGNLFLLPDGSLALTIVSRNESLVHGDGVIAPVFEAIVRTTRKISSVRQHSVCGECALEWQPTEDGVSLKVTGHNTFSVIILGQ